MCGLFVFSVMSVLFPLSNQITGPITYDDDLATMEGSGGYNSSELDYCGHNLSVDGNLVNENSVARIPARVWIWLAFILTVWIISRLVQFRRHL